MAEEEVITTTTEPVTEEPTLSFGNKTVDKYYQTILKTLKPETIEQQIIRTPSQTREEISQGVQSYLRPQLRQGLSDLREATRQNVAELDADAASRGMVGSTWLTDAKNRQYKAENLQRASMYNNYNSALAQQVEGQYANYLERLRAVDTQNAANKIEVDEWNAQVMTALEKLAYERALQAYKLSAAGSGGGRRGGSRRVVDDGNGITKVQTGDGQVLEDYYIAGYGIAEPKIDLSRARNTELVGTGSKAGQTQKYYSNPNNYQYGKTTAYQNAINKARNYGR